MLDLDSKTCGHLTIKLSNNKGVTFGADPDISSAIELNLEHDSICIFNEKTIWQTKTTKSSKPFFSLLRAQESKRLILFLMFAVDRYFFSISKFLSDMHFNQDVRR